MPDEPISPGEIIIPDGETDPNLSAEGEEII